MKKPFSLQKPLVRLILTVTIIILASYLLSAVFYRIDLTAEKRYTLSDYSKSTLRELSDVVFIKVYLDGDLNIPFRKMQQRLKELLDEFRVYAGDNLAYEFINPFAGEDVTARNDLANELAEKGLKPTNILDRDREGGTSEKLVFPGALVHFRGTEVPVNLLRNKPGIAAEENINNSIQAFEFELIRIISSLSADTVEKIAFLEGHGEFDEYQVGDITRELAWYFQVDRGSLRGIPGELDQYKAVIVAGPTGAFSEKDKFMLDQYLMQGGKLLWFIDMVNASFDSIREGGSMIALIRSLNIEDLLFRYGVRINPLLIQDVQCNQIPVNVALSGNTPNFVPAPWLYSPLFAAPYAHPVTRNLNLIRADFAGSIDTLAARKEITKTVLLRSSDFSRLVNAPVLISLEEVRLVPKEQDFTARFLPVAVLLEGSFESAFRNRMITSLFPDTTVRLMDPGQPASMLVVADADIIRNDVRTTPQGVYLSPLGFDRYTQQTYGNKEFIINVLQYMTGHADLISLRSRELSLRLLDKAKLKDQHVKWVLINTLGPPLWVILAGILYSWFRKRKYSRMLSP